MNIMCKYFVFLCVLIGLTAAPSLLAGTDTPRIDVRQRHQQQLIRRGISSERVSPSEAKELVKQQSRIKRIQTLSKADGVITDKERAFLTHQQNQARRSIARKKHNERKLDDVLEHLHFRR